MLHLSMGGFLISCELTMDMMIDTTYSDNRHYTRHNNTTMSDILMFTDGLVLRPPDM